MRPGRGAVLAPPPLVTRFASALSFACLSGALGGCYASAGAYAEPEYVEVETVPPHVEVYPRYYYGGRTVYLVDGRWYYRRGPHWVYYREEPAVLHRHRVYVQRVPRAPAHRHQRYYHRPARPAEDRD